MAIKMIPYVTTEGTYITDGKTFKVRHEYEGFGITLYNNKSEPNRVSKDITEVGSIYGTLRKECSIIEPIITIEYDGFPTFNYVRVDAFDRYYFVTDIVSVRQNVWEISLNIDVLMSYKNAIAECVGFIDRNEFTFDHMLQDKKLVIEYGLDVKDIPINNYVFEDFDDKIGEDTITGQYILNGFLLTLG